MFGNKKQNKKQKKTINYIISTRNILQKGEEGNIRDE